MRRVGIIAFLALFSVRAWADLAKTDFSVLCTQLFQPQPTLSNYASYFTPYFQAKISLDQLKADSIRLFRDVGRCVSYTAEPQGKSRYQLGLMTDKGLRIQLTATVEDSTGLVSGLLIDGVDDPAVQIESWSDVGSALTRLDGAGKVSATLETQDHSVFLTQNASDVFGIGSTFKLYVLGALELAIEKGEHHWNEVLPLKDEWKSLPSGIMHTWPAGKEVKLIEYAENMISISDNTAADHLLYLLGRDHVEAMLAPMGNAHEVDYLPFLSTLEMFKLKWALKPDETNTYLAAGKSDRLQMLDPLKQIPRSAVGTNGVSLSQPTLIDKLEWFATTPENCEAMFWLASRNSPHVRQVLTKSVPWIDDAGKESSHWAYAGYKGGSEPGVLSMTFLLESKSGKRGCFAMSANNASQSISQYRFSDIVKKTLKFAEQKL